MIRNPDVVERLGSLIGKELTMESLHETLFCEDKHQKIRRRYNVGTHTYIQYKIKSQNEQTFVDILISGNPNTFRMGIEETDGKLLLNSEPRVSYSYL